MPKFEAAGVVEALDFDLRPYVDAHGTIPEPSDRQVAEFMNGMKKVVKEQQDHIPAGVDPNDPAQLLQALNDLDPETVIKLMAEMSGVYAKVCSGTPTKTQIQGLPIRVRQIFFGWLQSELLNPEAAPGAGNGAATTPPLAVAG
jgi:hypothetical protein